MAIDMCSVKENMRRIARQSLGEPEKTDNEKDVYLCPFHSEETGSLTVYDDHYFCYGCSAHGDVVDFLMNREHLSFQEALAMLTKDAINLIPPKAKEHVPKIKTPPPEDWQEDAMLFVTRCHAALFESANKPIKDYLNKRGIVDSALMYNLIGLNTEDRRTTWGSEAVYLPYGITIPLHLADQNHLWAVKIRQRKDRTPKYVHASGSVPGLYGADTIGDNKHVFITEGEFDCLVLRQAAFGLAAVVTFGAATTHDLDTWIPYLGGVSRMYIVGDNDEAGEKMWQWWASQTKRARKAFVPQGKDITEFWQSGGDLTAYVAGHARPGLERT